LCELRFKLPLEPDQVVRQWHPIGFHLIELLPDDEIELMPIFGLVLHASDKQPEFALQSLERHSGFSLALPRRINAQDPKALPVLLTLEMSRQPPLNIEYSALLRESTVQFVRRNIRPREISP
jgi:hypothetical protein